MKKYIVLGLLVLIPTFVQAHVVVFPKTVPPSAYQTFTMGVPSERGATTIKVRLLIPDGLTSVMPTVKPGWMIATSTKEITWSGGSIPAGFRDEFTFSAKTPAGGSLAWKAYQTYGDGAVVAWEAMGTSTGMHNHQSPSGPASITLITSTTTTHTTHSRVSHDLFLPLLALGLAILALNEVIDLQKRK